VRRLVLVFALAGCVGDDPSTTPATDAGAAAGSGTMAISVARTWIHQGETIPVAFNVTRTAAGPLVVRAAALPAGVTAAEVQVDDTGRGSLALVASGDAPAGVSSEASIELVSGSSPVDRKPMAIKIAGPPGDLDTTFGSGGKRTLQIRHPDGTPGIGPGNAWADSVAMYPASSGAHAGKIVVGGRSTASPPPALGSVLAYVARFNADGTLDTSFGEPAQAGKRGYVGLPITRTPMPPSRSRSTRRAASSWERRRAEGSTSSFAA
jgi:hypothetical protein